MVVCFKCAKVIRGEAVTTNPPLLMLQLGDFAKSFHPHCYELAEKEAGKTLKGGNRG
jgi:hypothetical protein